MKKDKVIVGLLAHVDAGKTTLAEGILYTCGAIRKLGRVDHQDAFLDTFAMERTRGITIFSKQAQVSFQDLELTILDTPGHVDFSAEMERTLQVLDYAVLVISGTDGVQGHVKTLWRLLEKYEIPTFLFVNKMDQPDTDRKKIIAQLQNQLSVACEDFGCLNHQETFYDGLAMCEETLLEEYLEKGFISRESISEAITLRRVFPCYFGSALRLEGIEELLMGLRTYVEIPQYGQQFSARVYKIARDSGGNRLTYLKVTGGCLRAKMLLDNENSALDKGEVFHEKVNEIRVYNGVQYELTKELAAGEIGAVTGLTKTFPGQGLGQEAENEHPILEPVLSYQLILPEDIDAVTALTQLRQLEEEEPLLRVVWKESLQEIHVQVMGVVQIEVIKAQMRERFGWEADFGQGSIVYKETILEPIIGIGHFEPLRHYAEVHLLLEPLERGSGLQFASLCSEEILAKNWQRLVLTHLEEKAHIGVLTGSEITDMRISLISGKAHLKHTEGGDFRQATYRAVRQGLRQAKSILLEPSLSLTMELPTECLGRAMTDIQRMQGNFAPPITKGDTSILTSEVPVSAMQTYQQEFHAYTKGQGRMSSMPGKYVPCHNAEEIVEARGYDPDADMANPTSSVFCAHGAGFVVDYQQVGEYAHMKSSFTLDQQHRLSGIQIQEIQGYAEVLRGPENKEATSKGSQSNYISQEEIEEIFQRAYGKKTSDKNHFRRYHRQAEGRSGNNYQHDGRSTSKNREAGYNNAALDKYLLVDGYNIIFAWEELRELAMRNIDSARDKLIDILSNYQGYLGSTTIVVFDAYKVKGNPGTSSQYHNIHVVYTKEAETADQYIEKTVHQMASRYQVTVATSDALEQMIIWGEGALRLSAMGLKEAIEQAQQQMREEYHI